MLVKPNAAQTLLQKVYTVSNITEDDVFTWIAQWYPILKKEQIEHSLPGDTEIALSYEERGYYMVSWNKKAVYWTEKTDVCLVTNNDRWVLSDAHLGKSL